ncbi:MAG: putative Ig domain-containing protein, partial [Sulfitobacter sp.]
DDFGNRPPRITSDPVIDAYVGEIYHYDVDAIDPDGDDITYTLVSGPEGLRLLPDDRGMLQWDAPSSLSGQTVDVVVQADDGRGGTALHEFSIYVHTNPGNLPPIIISEPDLLHVVSAFPNAPLGDVNPTAVHLELAPGESADVPVSVGTANPDSPVINLPEVVPNKLEVIDTIDEDLLLQALLAGGDSGIIVNSVNLSGHSRGTGDSLTASTGVYLNDSITYGLDQYGIVISSGTASHYKSGPGSSGSRSTSFGQVATQAQSAILRPISGNFTFYDATQLDITFELQPGIAAVTFNVVFGSEEYPEWVNSSFIDGFGLLVNGRNVAFANDEPININHPDFRTAPGTELDGVIIPYTETAPGVVDEDEATRAALHFHIPLLDGEQDADLTFIIADASDGIYDTTAYISGLSGALANPIELDAIVLDPTADFVNETGVVTGVLPGSNAYFDTTITGSGVGESYDILITNPNDGILAGSIPVTINTGYFYLVQAIDPDGDDITYELTAAPDGATIDPDTALIQWVPPAPGDYEFSIRVDDGRGGSDEQTFIVVVSDSAGGNQAPTIDAIDDLTAEIGRPIQIQATASDPDGDSLKYYLSDQPAGMIIDPDTGVISWLPGTAQGGLVDPTVTVTVIDRRGGVAATSFAVDVPENVIFVNTAPEITTDPNLIATANQLYRYDVDAIDADSDVLTYSISFGPE